MRSTACARNRGRSLQGPVRPRSMSSSPCAIGAADDFHSLVLTVQLHRRIFSDLRVSVPFPRAAWHRDGRGMAGRGGTRDGILAIFVTPLYLWTQDPTHIIGGFILQGIFGGSIYGQNPSYLSERFPTEVR